MYTADSECDLHFGESSVECAAKLLHAQIHVMYNNQDRNDLEDLRSSPMISAILMLSYEKD